MSAYAFFSAPLDTRYDPKASKQLGKDHWRVLGEFRLWAELPGHGRVWVTVPAGYLTDGASVPRPLWGLIPPWGPYGQAAVVHDLLCEYLQVMSYQGLIDISREECDLLFKIAMGILEVPPLLMHSMYVGVGAYRVLGGRSGPTTSLEKRLLEASWEA